MDIEISQPYQVEIRISQTSIMLLNVVANDDVVDVARSM